MGAAGNPPKAIVEKAIDSILGITVYATAIQHELLVIICPSIGGLPQAFLWLRQKCLRNDGYMTGTSAGVAFRARPGSMSQEMEA